MLWKKLNSPPPSTILKEFKNQEYEFTIPKSRTRLVEKREVEKEKHRWLATGYVLRKRNNTTFLISDSDRVRTKTILVTVK